MVIQSFQHTDAMPAAQRQSSGLGHVFGWVVIALIFSQGFSRGVTMRTDSSDTANVVAVMGRHQHVSSAAAFRNAEVTTILGRADLDLRTATVAPGEEAEIEVFTLMGESAIRVPEGWNVDLRATRVLGGIRDRRTGARDVAGQPRIVIRGFVMWGALVIRS